MDKINSYTDIEYIGELQYKWNDLRNKSILLSGGTGFIGSLFADVIKYRNAKYGDNIQLAIITRKAKDNECNIEYLVADLSQPFYSKREFDYVIHAASNTHPKQYADMPIETILTNIVGCQSLLEIAKNNTQSTFVLASSVEIYGDGTLTPMDEKYCGYIDCNNARSGYNESKRLCESLCQAYRKQYGIRCVIARLSRCFGADKTKQDTKALAQFIDNSISKKDIVLKSLGNQMFSYCYIADAVAGIFKLIFDGVDGEAYNISADNDGLCLREYAEFIAELNGQKVILDIDKNQKGISQSSYALISNDKIKLLGWSPKYTVKQGLQHTMEILKGNC